jgi:hypothetical protein
MRFRKLRIAWSVVWGVVGLVSLILCLRSYWRMDQLQLPIPGNRGALLSSRVGQFRFAADENIPRTFNHLSQKVKERSVQPVPVSRFGFAYSRATLANRVDITVPAWIVPLTCLSLTPVTWLRFKRFSLRTLLIAVLLALIVWLR